MFTMKVCVVGAGAIGGFVGARLGFAGNEVWLVDRGAHLAAIKENGLTVIEDGEERVLREVRATDRLSEPGPQDVVLLCLKAHQIAAVAADIEALFGPDTVLVPMQNGVPWWYFQGLGGAYDGHVVESVDPGGVISRAIDHRRIIGCIAYAGTEVARPGVIRHIEGQRFPIGELHGSESARAQQLSEMMAGAGFKSPLLPDVRSEVWLKLWGNLSFNPISALSHGTLAGICRFPPSRELAATMMAEARTIGESLGAHFRLPIERRIEGAEKVGEHKTSMLQDVELGKELEIEGILGAVVELGELSGAQVPTLKAVYACTSLLSEVIRERRVRICEEPL